MPCTAVASVSSMLCVVVVVVLVGTCSAAPPPGFVTTVMQGGYNNNNAFVPSKIRFLPNGQVMFSTRAGGFYVSSVPSGTSGAGLTPTLLFTPNSVNSNGEIG